MVRITAITPGYNEPSSRFRVRQYIPKLKENEIIVNEYWSSPRLSYKLPGKLGSVKQRYIFPLSGAVEFLKLCSLTTSFYASYRSDLVWMNRPAHNIVHLENYYKKPVVLDVDDAIWINAEKKIGSMAKNVSYILAGNSYIANWLSKYNQSIFIVPTAIDTSKFVPHSAIHTDERFIIGWTGSGDGLKYIYDIEDQLYAFLRNHKLSFIKIICDRKPVFRKIPEDKIIYVPWSPNIEHTELQDLSVGIMPLTDNEWSRGKCSFKMLQYMSTQIPVIVSDVGMNSEVLVKSEIGFGIKKLNEWGKALEILWWDKGLGRKMGENGRALVEKEYSVNVIAKKLCDIFINNISS